ncbi:DUF2255 family protein [Brenneria populi subsp. brevivirga]|uniref:DUF2255 family protein n=1 Tax=Brenneria populi TaxID=1505588 RepID=UPI002E1735BB|nr:DUF2255 family protein [Brenneria populi subsp. brevivirga]
MKFNPDTLVSIVKKDDLHVAPFRADGKTTGTPTWIWCVDVDGDLYVRAYSGVKSSWYQAAIKQKAGQITAIGQTFDVSFQPVSGAINDKVDDAYRDKYRNESYLPDMVAEQAREATIRISPRRA